ncbi:stalk domain-containing protein [Paenibacillus oryzisoli]|uniref:Copper amine oxidase-like N-terminal domain-containing protein n=1 Tax=Paenibacillus oryzisoli TaxID=1850517 RepID=A0A198A3Q6_9BACL|nr:stalk domain-containing protein [Paenibacillus oryzisoli]OAS15671.1 hypothetical protein A8708_03555 [Paenibacillus oryzisoli]
MYIQSKILAKTALALGLILNFTITTSIPHIHAEGASIGWKDIAVGGRVSLGIKNDGTVWAWGETNRNGVFGNGEKGPSATNTKVPTQVKELNNVISIAAGSEHALAVKKDGTVWVWGDNLGGQIGDGMQTSLETGSGKMVIDNNRALPHQVEGLSNVVSVWGAWGKSYAIKDDGTLWAWGGIYYKKPDGSTGTYTYPVQLRFQNVSSISTGYGDNLVVLGKDGAVWTLNQGAIVKIDGLSDITAIAAGGANSYALQKDGTVWAFGSSGQGVVAGQDTANKSAPQKVQGIQDIIDIRATAGGPLYLKKDGTVWTSGNNRGGQLGIGTYDNSDVPVQVNNLMKVTKIGAHGTGFRSLALREDGTLWSWGGGYSGDGTEWYRTEPVWIKSRNEEAPPQTTLISVRLDGTLLSFEQQPMMMNGSTLVPLRKIFESIGAVVTWDAASSTITATKGNSVLTLVVGNPTGILNGQSITLDAPPTNVNGSTLVPVRIAESLGSKVTWVPETQTVNILTK